MKNSLSTLRSLAGPHLYFALFLSLLAAVGTVLYPLILAKITNLVFAGAIGTRLPADGSLDEAVDQLRAEGQGALADVAAISGAVPGQGMEWESILRYAVLAAAVIVVVLIVRTASGLILNARIQATVRTLRERVNTKLHRLPIGEVTGDRRGKVLALTTADVDNVATVIGPVFVSAPVVALSLITTAIVLLVLNWQFALIVFVAIPVSTVAATFVARRAKPHLTVVWKSNEELTSHVEDTLTARDMLTAYDAHQQRARVFEVRNRQMARATKIGQRWSGSLAPILGFVNALIFVAIATLGAFRMLEGAITLGAVQAIIQYSQQLSSQSAELAGILPRIQSGLVSLSRVSEFLRRPDEPDPAIDDAEPTARPGRHAAPPAIVFDDVHFAYADGPEVISGVRLTVDGGQTLALVGATGSGKTTLTKLLQRFLEPTSGRILVADHDIADLPRSQVRSMMSVVAQEPWLQSGTAAENVAFGRDDGLIPDIPVIEEILTSLPSGGDTAVSGDTEILSTGEKQMLTVARALADGPRILILDEATSAADPRSELLIQRGIADLQRWTTTIVVTHRASTLALADKVAVLDDGRVVEYGTPAELLAVGGAFARLYRAD